MNSSKQKSISVPMCELIELRCTTAAENRMPRYECIILAQEKSKLLDSETGDA